MVVFTLPVDSLELLNKGALIAKQIYDPIPQIAVSLGAGGLANLIHASITEFANSPMAQTTTRVDIGGYISRVTSIVTAMGLGGLVATQFRGDFENYLTDIGLALLGNYLASQPVNRLMRHI